MNSREKGKRGERQWRDVLRAEGFHARRGQQFAGGTESPDVICDDLPWIHFEVKAVERLNIEEAMAQARRDACTKTPMVAHRRNFRPWLVTMEAEAFFRLLRGDYAERGNRNAERGSWDGESGGNGSAGAPDERGTRNAELGSEDKNGDGSPECGIGDRLTGRFAPPGLGHGGTRGVGHASRAG
jgi:hypothetical protein